MSMFQPGAPASSAVHPSDSVADPLPPQRVELLDDPQEWLAFGRPCTPAGSPLSSGATVVALKVVPRYPRSYFEGGMPVDMNDVKRIEAQWGDAAQAMVCLLYTSPSPRD